MPRPPATDQPCLRPMAAAIAVNTSCVLPVFLTGALSVQVRRSLRFDEVGLGAAVAAFFAAGAASSAGLGHLAERRGAERVMTAAVLAAGGAMAAVAVLSRSLWELVGFLAVAGVANGAAQPATNLFLARRVPVSRQGLAFGVKQAGVPVATLVGGLAVPVVALTVGWRFAFGGAAVFAAALVAFGVARPSRVATPAASGTGGAEPRARLPAAARAGLSGSAASPRLRQLAMLAVAMGLGAGAANALGAFIVSGGVAYGWAPGAAGLVAAAGSLAGLASRLGSGLLADRRPRQRHFLVVASMLAGGALGDALLATGNTVAFLPAVLITFAAGWGWPGLFNFAVVQAYQRSPGTATGITQTGTYLGAVLGPLAFGLLAQHAGYPAAWLFAAAASAAAAGAMVVGGRALARAS
ncbi:MAG: MFS transporter [Acidimicrobiales bacterium]